MSTENTSERGERVQVIVAPAVAAKLQEIADREGRSRSNLCQRILNAWLQARTLRAGCKHMECVRVGIQHDHLNLVCVDCGQTLQMTTDDVRRSGVTVHARRVSKEKS